MGKVEGHRKRSRTSRDIVQMTSGMCEMMSKNGIMGR